MGKPIEWIVDEYQARRRARGSLLAAMEEARAHFNGDVVIPLPEMDRDERPAVANLLQHGLDQTAMRVASVLPNLHFPAVIPGKDKGTASEDWARRRRLAVAGWWEQSRLELKNRRIARWLVGYGTAPLLVRPNFDKGIPEYVLRDPLSTFPDLDVDYDDEQPENFIYAYRRTILWLRRRFPEAAALLERRHSARGKFPGDTVVEILEYVDADERVMLATFRGRLANQSMSLDVSSEHIASGTEIVRVPNKAGICWGVSANRITIDRLQGQFDQVFGTYQQQAKLQALEVIAVSKSIFPDLAISGNQMGTTPTLVGGVWHDGRSGKVNIIKDGKVDVVQLNPGFLTQPLIDRHERAIRQSGVPAQFSGETPTNIATGRLGDQILSATVDFPIQEYQQVEANTLHEANLRAIEISKAYFGEVSKSYVVDFPGAKGRVTYTPNQHFETSNHKVRYSAPGADVNSLVIGIGQRLGIGTMSTWTAMQQDPLVEDPEFEYARVPSERLQRALLEYVTTQVANGAMDPQDVVLLYEQIESGANLAEAWKAAQVAAQKRQAEAMAAAQEQMGPEGAMSPEMQPGLSPPVEGAEAGLPIGPPQPSSVNLANLLGTLRQPRSIVSPLGQAQPPVTPVGA